MDGRHYHNSLRRLRLFASEADLTADKVSKLVQPFIEAWRPIQVPNRKDANIPMDPEFMLTDPALADLAARIRALGMNLNKSGRKGIEYHNAFQRHLATMAEMFDCQAWRESHALFDDPDDPLLSPNLNPYLNPNLVPLPAEQSPRQLAGRVDVIWARKRIPVVVFEVDSTIKPRSFQKLKEAAAAHKLWIYFGRDLWGFRTFLQKNDPAREVLPIIIPPTFIPSFADIKTET
jgi:hypothetical protein